MRSNYSFWPLLGIVLVLCASCASRQLSTRITAPSASFDYVGDDAQGWKRVRHDTLWGYIHASAQRLIKPQFDWADDFREGFAVVQKGDRSGFVSLKGKRWGRIRYQQAGRFSYGVAPVKIRGQYGYLDTKRKWAIRPQYDLALPFEEGRAVVAVGLNYGFIDRAGSRITALKYDDAAPFYGGLAKVRKNGRFGMVDTSGVEVIPLVYTAIEPLVEGGYRLTGGAGSGLADENGRLLIRAEQHKIEPGEDGNFTIENHSGRKGLFCSKHKKLILPVIFDAIYPAGNGMYLCIQNNRYLYADSIGRMLFDGIAFEDAGLFSDGLAAVQLDGKWGYIDTTGKLAIPYQFDAFDNRHYARMRFSGNRAWVRKNGSTTLIDRSGSVIATTEYESALPFTGNRALVMDKSEQIGYVDTLGVVRIPLIYTGGITFNAYGIGWVTKSPYGVSSYHTINTHGEIIDSLGFQSPKVFNAQYWYTDRPKQALLVDRRTGKITGYPYDNIYRPSNMSNELFYASKSGLSGLIDTSMTEVIPMRYQTVERFHHNRARVASETGEGFVDRQARETLPLHYEKVSYFRHPITEVVHEGKHGVLDTAGRVVIPLIYDEVDIDYANNRIITTDSLGARVFDCYGRLISDRVYDRVFGFASNRATVRKNGKTGVVDYHFRELCPPIYDRIGYFEADGMAWVINEGKVGYLDEAYAVRIPIIYEDGDIFIHGMAKVKLDGKELFINKEGKQVYPDEQAIQAREAAKEQIREDLRWLDSSS